MTDLRERFAAMLGGEPDAPDDLDRVVAGGRRALRRRNTLTAVAGTAGTAAVTAAIVVPITAAQGGGSTDRITTLASASPTPTSPPRCKLYYVPRHGGRPGSKQHFLAGVKGLSAREGRTYGVRTIITEHDRYVVELCPHGASPDAAGDITKPTPTTPPQPSYHYSGDPQTIADGFTSELARQVKARGLTIVYTRPFAQESSKVEPGHPTYYDGNVDVQLPDGPADISVQVTHEVTEQVPFDGACDPSNCTQTTLADGSEMQTSTVGKGPGGTGTIVVVEIHHPNGLVVEAQTSNYAFGPEATRARTSNQPLTQDQLTQLAEDPAFTF
jgi:hypothetical protein